MRYVVMAMLALVLAGCAPDQSAQQFKRMEAACVAAHDTMPTATARAQCMAGALEQSFPKDPMAFVLAKGLVSIGEKLDRREITESEAEFQLSKLVFDLKNQADQTRAAKVSAALLLLR